MRLFDLILEAALNDLFGGIQPNDQQLPPLKDRIATAVKSGKLKPGTNDFESIYFLERQLGKITPADRQMLLQNNAWYQDNIGSWVLDVRRIPGLAAPQQQMAALPVQYRNALAKLINNLKAGKMSAADTYVGKNSLAGYGISPEEVDLLFKLGVMKRVQGGGMGDMTVDIQKLSEVRKQQKI